MPYEIGDKVERASLRAKIEENIALQRRWPHGPPQGEVVGMGEDGAYEVRFLDYQMPNHIFIKEEFLVPWAGTEEDEAAQSEILDEQLAFSQEIEEEAAKSPSYTSVSELVDNVYEATVGDSRAFVAYRIDPNQMERDARDDAHAMGAAFVDICDEFLQHTGFYDRNPSKVDLLRAVKPWASSRISHPFEWAIQMEDGPRAVVTLYHVGEDE